MYEKRCWHVWGYTDYSAMKKEKNACFCMAYHCLNEKRQVASSFLHRKKRTVGLFKPNGRYRFLEKK